MNEPISKTMLKNYFLAKEQLVKAINDVDSQIYSMLSPKSEIVSNVNDKMVKKLGFGADSNDIKWAREVLKKEFSLGVEDGSITVNGIIVPDYVFTSDMSEMSTRVRFQCVENKISYLKNDIESITRRAEYLASKPEFAMKLVELLGYEIKNDSVQKTEEKIKSLEKYRKNLQSKLKNIFSEKQKRTKYGKGHELNNRKH